MLVNCAGYFPMRPFEEMTPDEWRRVIDINLTGAFLTTRAILPLMKGRGLAPIINLGWGSVFEGLSGQAHYVAAKARLVGPSRRLARGFGGYGITVDVVTPGLTVTSPVRQNFSHLRSSKRSTGNVRWGATSNRKTSSGRCSSSSRRIRTLSSGRSSTWTAESTCTNATGGPIEQEATPTPRLYDRVRSPPAGPGAASAPPV